MMDYLNKLSRFERITRQIIEGSVDKALGASSLANEIANELALAIDKCASKKILPNQFEIYLKDEAYVTLLDEIPNPEQHFVGFIEQLALETGTLLSGEAEVQILKSPSDTASKIVVFCGPALENDEVTQAFTARPNSFALENIKAVDAFLIVSGKRHVSIDQAVTDIGRQLDNNLVLDDATVSRKHAQIRWRFGRFVIHDVGSKAGTFVNGKKISESVLESGDIVTLGKISLIYGEDQINRKDISSTDHDKSGTTRELRRDNLP